MAATGWSADGATPGPVIRNEDINTPQSGPGEHFARYDTLQARETSILYGGMTNTDGPCASPTTGLDPDVAVREHGAQVGLDNLPLVWDRR